MPRYQHASDAGEGVILENRFLKLDVRKCLTGWGWGELCTGRGEFVAVTPLSLLDSEARP